MLLVDELHIRQISFVEDDAHNSLSGPNRAVYLGVDLVNAYRVSLSHKSIEDVFTKFLPFDDHLFALRMQFGVKDCESVDAVCFFSDARSD